MPNTRAVTFNIDTYRDDFKKIMVTALENAIKDNKLASNCGASVKSEYSGSSKQAMLESYAENVLNTVIYKISCEVMTANNVWVAQVTSAYTQYCDNILQQDSGVNAFLNYIFLTHAFEGEVKDDIIKFCDAMIAQVGFYGELALTCTGQDSLQTTDTKEKLREYFVNTVTSLDARKAKAITGYNNYCYITGTILSADTISISSGISIEADGPDYKSCNVNSWEATVPNIVDSVYMPIIYNQYTKLTQGTNSFGEYLNKYGAQPDSSDKTYVTNYRGAEDFAFSEGIHMIARQAIGRYFEDGHWYNIDVGTGSKVEQEYYHCHDKVMVDLFDSTNAKPSINTMIAGRAFYGESHWYWDYDECWVFASDGVALNINWQDTHGNATFSKDGINILKSTPHHDMNGGDVDDPENPFFAYHHASLTTGVSDQMDPQYENTSKDITEVLLYSDSFAYTGEPIEPAVTVLASEDVVSEDGYVVTYINNIESGDNAVVRVQGIGDYSGVITRHFTITDAPSSSAGYLGSSSGGCNTMSSAGLMLGLVFVIKKFRRR